MVWLARSWCCRSQVHFEFCVCKGQWFWPLQIWFSCATGNQKTQRRFGQDMPRNVILLCDLNPRQGQRQLLCIARVLWFKMNAKQFVNRWFVKQKCHVEGMHVLMCWNMRAQQRSRGQKKTFVFQMAKHKTAQWFWFSKMSTHVYDANVGFVVVFNLCSSSSNCTQCTVSVACLKANVFSVCVSCVSNFFMVCRIGDLFCDGNL